MPRFDLMRNAIDNISNQYQSSRKRFNVIMHWCASQPGYDYKSNALNYAYAMGYLD